MADHAHKVKVAGKTYTTGGAVKVPKAGRKRMEGGKVGGKVTKAMKRVKP